MVVNDLKRFVLNDVGQQQRAEDASQSWLVQLGACNTVNYTAQTNCFIEEIFGKQDFATMSLMSQ